MWWHRILDIWPDIPSGQWKSRSGSTRVFGSLCDKKQHETKMKQNTNLDTTRNNTKELFDIWQIGTDIKTGRSHKLRRQEFQENLTRTTESSKFYLEHKTAITWTCFPLWPFWSQLYYRLQAAAEARRSERYYSAMVVAGSLWKYHSAMTTAG